jgi:hypothetical protein
VIASRGSASVCSLRGTDVGEAIGWELSWWDFAKEFLFEKTPVTAFLVGVFITDQPDVLAVLKAVEDVLDGLLGVVVFEIGSVSVSEIDCSPCVVMADIVGFGFEFGEEGVWRGEDRPVIVDETSEPVLCPSNDSEDKRGVGRDDVIVLECGLVGVVESVGWSRWRVSKSV